MIWFFGYVPSSQALLFPEKVSFGNVITGDSSVKKVWIKNESNSRLSLSFHLNVGNFTLTPSGSSLDAQDSLEMQIKFAPEQNVIYRGYIIIYTNQVPGQHLIRLEGNGKLSNAYYDATFNLYDEALKSAFKTLLAQGYQSLGYNSARDQMYGSLDNQSGWVTCVYTGRQAQFNTRSGATSNNFNCEHTWPQSLFSSNEPMRSDIHHLFSTDESANAKRDNDPFGAVSSPTWSVGGSKWASSVFEPRNEQKGATARAMFYFVLRYENYSGFLNAQEQVLRTWHVQYPPATWEKTRNDGIYALQKNRNPLTDFPGFLDRIYTFSGSGNRPFVYQIHWQRTSPSTIPAVEKKMHDTLSLWICNSATGLWRIDSMRTNGICYQNFPLVLNAGECVELKVSERTDPLLPAITLYSEKGIYEDSLRFVYKNVGSTSFVNYQQKLFPNPVDGDVLKYRGEACELTIRDILGKLVFFTDIKSDFDEIEISNLKTGVYFATIKVGNKLLTEKIVRR